MENKSHMQTGRGSIVWYGMCVLINVCVFVLRMKITQFFTRFTQPFYIEETVCLNLNNSCYANVACWEHTYQNLRKIDVIIKSMWQTWQTDKFKWNEWKWKWVKYIKQKKKTKFCFVCCFVFCSHGSHI